MEINKFNVKKILDSAEQLSPKIIALRRHFHKNPELGFKEFKTNNRICEELNKLSVFKLNNSIAGTGITGLLKPDNASNNSRVVGLRADMDALPLQEDNKLSYKSKNDGIMHACGHDGHMAMLLGALMILGEYREEFTGNVKFIFQPAEEHYGGARDMIKGGALAEPKLDGIFGLHQMPTLDFGKIAVSPGPVMAGGGGFMIRVEGAGCHAAYPWKGIDLVSAVADLCLKLQSIHNRISALENIVLALTSIKSSEDAFNIIPNAITIKGTLRTFSSETRETILKEITKILKGFDLAYGTKSKFELFEGYPPTVNDPDLAEIIKTTAEMLGYPCQDMVKEMGSEDFAYYQQQTKGGYFILGVGDAKHQAALHNPGFDFDDSVLVRGAAMLAMCAINFLNQDTNVKDLED